MLPIKSLDFKVAFNSTGKTITGSHNFEEGITAFVGPNGKGKSVRFEMIEYALFGTKALRASTANYKSIQVTLKWDDYRVERTKTAANLFKGSEKVATGATPVNQHIINLFGYDLRVFRIAHHIKQGDIEALSNMGPTERKAMVDQTVGLNLLDELIDQYKERINVARHTKTELEGQIGPRPVSPSAPDNYAPSGDVMARIKSMRALVSERSSSLRIVQEPNDLPDIPEVPEGDHAALIELDRQCREAQAERAALMGKMSAYPSEFPYSWTPNQLAEQRKANDDFLARPEQPQYDLEELEMFEGHQYGLRRCAIIRKIEKCQKVTCPSCSEQFRVDAGEYEAELAEHDDLYPNSEIDPNTPMPPIGLDEIERQRQLHKDFVEVPKPELTLSEIDHIEKQREGFKIWQTLQFELAALPEPKDVSDQLRRHEAYQIELEHYQKALSRYNQREEDRAAAKKILDKTQDCEEELEAAETLYPLCVQFEEAVKSVQKQIEEHTQRKARIAEVTLEYEGLVNLRKALRDLKTRVKTYLVPSLNRVASQLLNEMTEGDFANVEADEEFDINIDGQPIDTMSGGEKAVANLALRIALGRVLTHRKFSVLMGDEIDAAMDDERATLTQTCVSQLSSSIAQIMLITHKGIEADNVIELR